MRATPCSKKEAKHSSLSSPTTTIVMYQRHGSTDLSESLRACVEKDPKHVWKTLVNRAEVRRGNGIKKGTTLGKVMIEMRDTV